MSAAEDPFSPETVVPILTRSVGSLLRRLRADANPGGLSVSQTAVLARLEDSSQTNSGQTNSGQGMTNADLARAEAMKPQSMTPILASLEQEGLVERQPHPTDGRQILYSLTPRGLDARRRRTTAKQAWLIAAVARLSAEDRQTLLSAARLMQALVEPDADPQS